MPTSKSAKKKVKIDDVRRLRNKSAKSALRTQIKKFVSAVKSRDIGEAENHLSLAAKKLDKLAAKNIIHKNAASRKKSRLTKLLNKQKATAS